ncbi:sucrose synthase [Trichormus variabilis]|uniref:Sucrose synthase n=1 Tax=Trichormus variabilis SAG 1403-4b TaxID=447716 RepID=A0A3S1A6Q8_ANAVA|nr:sucrose synthase [Trichormus variabilis]MBD2628656.1 sucrose synthase [Trichormus variabilis FACHB-164]RUS94753.1 sucrose synthase [Trichormus variabilis SAG 1403-4b]
MYELVQTVLNSEEKTALQQFILTLGTTDKSYFLRNEILQGFANYCHQSQKPTYFYHSSSIGTLIHYTHEIILDHQSTWFVVRPKIASQEVWRLTADCSGFDLMTPKELLDVRDRLVNRYQPDLLEIDLHPFYQTSPSISDSRNIGQGLAFLNHYLCNQVVNDPEYWLELLFQALQRLQYNGIRLLIGLRIHSGIELAKQIKPAIAFLSARPPDEPYPEFRFLLQELGLEAGWGNNAGRIRETLELLQRLIDTPQPSILEAFVARIPAVFRVVLISIHGWVAQEDVLGRDETLGQVIYVLEQARSLENKLREEIKLAGLDILGIKPHVIILTRLIPNCEETFCDLRLEKVHNTENAWILRIPFGEFNPEVTNNWISKFEIWPYLEKFAHDAEKELLAQFNGKPNLIIGNYSDGNLVAFLLSRRLKVTQCNIAHSLEKPKYLFSNLYWQDLEEQYHFSAQFTADLISMNSADFIIASSYQEILGTPDTMGQYESYNCFTMPQLYHVINGIDLFSPKFNMVAPGVSETFFFPYSQTEKRNSLLCQDIQDLLFSREDDNIIGHLDDLKKRPIFAVTPVTSIKNLTGLAECFGQSQELQERCNLILLTSKVHPDQSTNSEDAREIEKLHDIINQYNIQGKIRWIGMRFPSRNMGEAYRIIADNQGIYVHFALYESFGRSILEAMISGLPTFATKFGGALEIIDNQDGEFYLNPTDLAGTATTILNFLDQCDKNPEYWQTTSQWMIQRIRHKYNWNLHTQQLLLLAKMFSFWNFVAPEDHEARDRYMETLFHLIYKPRAEKILAQHMERHALIEH